MALSMSLVGCVLEPKYHRPVVNIIRKFPSRSHVTLNDSIDLPDMLWWKQYQSPELNQLIQKALQQNNDLNIAMAKIDVAQSQLNEVKLNWLPGMTILGGQSQFPVLGNPGGFFIAAPLYILNAFQLYQQQKQAKALVSASRDACAVARLSIIAQVSASFFTLIAQQEALRLYQQLFKHQKDVLQLAQSKYSSGLTPEDELDLIKSQMKQTESQIAVTTHTITASKNTLRFLLNQNPGDLRVKTSFKKLDSDKLIPESCPITVLNNRPDVHEAESLLRAANANIGAVGASLLPSITVGAYLGKGSTIAGSINSTEAYLSTPILDFPVFAQINESKAEYRIAKSNYIKVIRAALRDVDDDLSAYLAFSHQLRANTSAFYNEKQHCHWVDLRFKNGLNDSFEVTQCKIKLDQFELLLNQNKLEKMITVVKLYQDLAGGYRGL